MGTRHTSAIFIFIFIIFKRAYININIYTYAYLPYLPDERPEPGVVQTRTIHVHELGPSRRLRGLLCRLPVESLVHVHSQTRVDAWVEGSELLWGQREEEDGGVLGPALDLVEEERARMHGRLTLDTKQRDD
jgi:hypothetical protein